MSAKMMNRLDLFEMYNGGGSVPLEVPSDKPYFVAIAIDERGGVFITFMRDPRLAELFDWGPA